MVKMTENLIIRKEATFQSEARILEELGERLVASADVAIVELIKNAYDADAPECRLDLADKGKTLIIEDTGHGITEEEFLNKWMYIATGSKREEKFSRIYKRKLTGAKGIGRFSVRFLGSYLTLESIAYDNTRKIKTQLIADFDWQEINKSQDIRDVKIPYKLYSQPNSAKTGTTLKITGLRYTKEGKEGSVFSKKIQTEILKIITPLSGFESGRFSREESTSEKDPGFKVNLAGLTDEDRKIDENLAKKILQNYRIRLKIDLFKSHLNYKMYLQDKNKPIFEFEQECSSDIKKGLVADIRFFPKRKGVFSGKDFDGREAWRWIYGYAGVAVVDHGFRIKPYGFGDDDWLMIAQDKAINRRKWRSGIMTQNYKISKEIYNDPAQNPMLYLPRTHQLIGVVFIESGPVVKSGSSNDLIPTMDREGLLKNKAFKDLFEIVRAGIEMIALIDKREQDKMANKKAKEASEKARHDIKKSIEYIKKISTLTKTDKDRIITQYSHLAENIEELDDYDRRARQNLETMSLLGVVAGFMTHESGRILHNLKEVLKTLRKIPKKHKNIREYLSKIEINCEEFSNYIDYTSLFIKSVHDSRELTFKTLPQIDRIINIFGKAVKYRNVNIKVIKDIDKNLKTPPVSIALYSGVILNLYVNAIKAILAGPSDPKNPKILLKAWNESNKHVIEVMDNGIGVPPTLEKRIWDPLFTTTSNLNNPLGTGMGLGLSIIKKTLKEIGGSINLSKPTKEFSTCFRVEFPFDRRRKNAKS